MNNREVENKAEKSHTHPKEVTFIVNKDKIIRTLSMNQFFFLTKMTSEIFRRKKTSRTQFACITKQNKIRVRDKLKLVMEDLKERALTTLANQPLFWKRFVDEVSTTTKPGSTQTFLHHLNSIEPCITFTIEND